MGLSAQQPCNRSKSAGFAAHGESGVRRHKSAWACDRARSADAQSPPNSIVVRNESDFVA